MKNHAYSVETIRDYLLGQLPEPETERLDELSITDAECAALIKAVEHDLADAYALGELRGAAREQFRSKMLATPQQREAARFAEALQSLNETSSLGSLPVGPRPSVQNRERARRFHWVLAAAAVLLAATSAWLALDNRLLRARATTAELARDELQRNQQVREAEARRSADPAPPPVTQAPPPLTVATLVLAPQRRSARQSPTVALTGDSGELSLQLDLEPVDYPAYEASLVASSGTRSVWSSDRLVARTAGERRMIDVRLPVEILIAQEYLIRVSGLPARGPSEIVGEYRFTVVRSSR